MPDHLSDPPQVTKNSRTPDLRPARDPPVLRDLRLARDPSVLYDLSPARDTPVRDLNQSPPTEATLTAKEIVTICSIQRTGVAITMLRENHALLRPIKQHD